MVTSIPCVVELERLLSEANEQLRKGRVMNRKQRNNRKAIMLVDGDIWRLQFSEGENYRKGWRAMARVEKYNFIRQIKSGRKMWRYKARRKLQPERGEAQKARRRYMWYCKMKGVGIYARPF